MTDANSNRKPAYICDPAKNTLCTKEGCMIFHHCRCTTNKEFAKTGENNKPIVAVRSDLDGESPTEIKYPCGRCQTYGCGLDFNTPKYKEDCYFYGETNDMGAIIRYCTQAEIEWGYCPCEKCDKYLSNAEASKIIRKYIEKGQKQNE